MKILGEVLIGLFALLIVGTSLYVFHNMSEADKSDLIIMLQQWE